MSNYTSHYDDPVFFEKYAQMGRSQYGLSGAGEWPTLQAMLPDLTPLSPDAPANVELTVFRDGRELLVNAAVLCEETESIPSAPFTVCIRTEQPPSSVVLLPAETPVPFEWKDGMLRFAARSVHIFDMYRIME